ncbi:TM0106 family RecB-like putative nuclease [Corynebacterium mayonis]|uniref:TM0106 family RecB-like putative nuclease n=1 Tax=Corynebacterium mayonis TaxID=3062461 RepID=UPI003CC7C97F
MGPVVVRASDLVGCRYRLRQRLKYPEVPPLPDAVERQPLIDAARAAVFSALPVKRALGDGSSRRFTRIDLDPSWPAESEKATRLAMHRGADLITHALLTGTIDGVDVVAEIDILARQGSHYLPVMISSHRVARTTEAGQEISFIPTGRLSLGQPIAVQGRARNHTVDGYRLALAHALLGEASAGEGALIGQDRGRAYLVDVERKLAPLREALAAPVPTEPLRLKQCASCRFWPLCSPRLRELDEVSLVYPGGRADALRERGINTVADLIEADLGEPSTVARAWREGIPVLKRAGGPDIPRADVEIDVDMEAYLDQGAYLWGAFDGEVYHAFVTWEEVGTQAEEANFRAFWTWLMDVRASAHDMGKTFAAYCYAAGGENHWLKSSAERFGSVDLEDVQRFIASDEWVDVFAYCRRNLVGTEGLGLKVLGPVAGFLWEDDNVDGERSVALRLAARGGDHNAREMLLRYNEDDCRATRAVRDFIAAGAPGVPEI